MRLASSNNPGAIITPAINLSEPVKLTVRARQYNSDSGAELTLSVDNVKQQSWVTSSLNQDFTATLPVQSTTAKISLSAASGKRVYVDYVKAETQGVSYTETAVNGYPVNVGNVLNYQVNGLEADSAYFYKVSVQNDPSITSSAIAVRTSKTTNLPNVNKPAYTWVRSSTGVTVFNLEPNSQLLIYDTKGQKLHEARNNNSQTNISLNFKGLYFVNIVTNNNSQTIKVLY